MRRTILMISIAAVAVVLAACTPTEPPKSGNIPISAPGPSGTPTPSSPASPTHSVSQSVDPKTPATPTSEVSGLEGSWPGVEGAGLKIIREGEKYKVEIKNVDGKTETFDGVKRDDGIQFKRKDKLETIRAATAEETGMKWLSGEKNCVVITKGSEGYCRK